VVILPELPEIESLARQLAEHVVGDTITQVTTRQPRALNVPVEELPRRAGGPIRNVGRTGKSMTLEVPRGSVWLHLGVNGQILLVPAREAPGDEVIRFTLDSGRALIMQRMFMGHAHFHTSDELEKLQAGFGVDPLSEHFTVEFLRDIFARKKKAPVKAVLMDQKLIAGLGNSYSDEVLFAARIHPHKIAAELSPEEIERLHAGTHRVLEQAISLGGDNEYTDLFGVQGRSSTAIHSHDTCTVCGTPVEQIKGGGRTTYVCPACQPLL
jgi:formamidopyrimidine-DNA glycosylase